jgi:N-acetylmuramoyl-L-alanine amidase
MARPILVRLLSGRVRWQRWRGHTHFGSGAAIRLSPFLLARNLGGGCRALTADLNSLWRSFSGWIVVAALAAAAPGHGLAQAPAAAPAPAAPAASSKAVQGPRFVVVLDAAHGGDDGGGQVGAAVAEKTVTLAVSVRLRSLLAARGFSVVTTRESNVNLDTDARAQIANHATYGSGGAAACVSFHASQAGTGVHLFVSSLEPGGAGRFLAWKTAQAAFVARSLKLAGTVNSALQHSTGDVGGGETGAGPIPATLARASLPGLDSLTCPALAIEIAPLRDAEQKVTTEVTDPQYQTQVVEALAAALLEWKTDADTEPRPDLRPDTRGGAGAQP